MDDKHLTEVRKLIEDWYSFKLKATATDLMPYLVYMLERCEQLESEKEHFTQNNQKKSKKSH